MIDTTEKSHVDATALSNVAETDVQRALKMDDALANHTTHSLGENDMTVCPKDKEILQKEFDDALRPTSKNMTLNELYTEELNIFENMQYRATFFNILAYGYRN